MSFKAGTVLFSCPSGDDCMAEAQKYIRKNNLTVDDVRVMRGEKSGAINIVAKKEVELPT